MNMFKQYYSQLTDIISIVGPELHEVHGVPTPEAGVASEHDAGLPVLRRHALVAETREALEAAAPHQVTVYKRFLRNINSEAQNDLR